MANSLPGALNQPKTTPTTKLPIKIPTRIPVGCSASKAKAKTPLTAIRIGRRLLILLPVLRFAYSFTVSVKSNRDPKAAVRFWWQGQKESNPQPTVLETVALPIELYP